MTAQKTKPPITKKLIIIRGRGTPNERRIETNVTLYWTELLGWVTIPTDDED